MLHCITSLLMPVHSCGGDWDLYTQLVSKEHKQVTYLSLSGHRQDDIGKNEWGESRSGKEWWHTTNVII